MSNLIPSRNLRDWQQLDARHYLHPFTDAKALAAAGSRIVARAQGAYIYDQDGREIMDGMSGLWCCGLGYGQERIAEAVSRQLRELPYCNSFFQCAHPPAIELARQLAAAAPPHINHAFFTSGGSEANDTCLRLIRRYWDLRGEPNRCYVIARENAYHGSTIAAASLGGMKAMREQFETLDYISHIRQPYWYGEGGELSAEEFGLQAADALRGRIEELGPEQVAAFVAEPVQGAGGVIVPPDNYWPAVKRICDEYGILAVSDEVICGFGRMGEWFGADYYDWQADLMTFAKAVTNGYQPLGGVLVGDRIADLLIAEGGEFTHGYTYSGHPAACAAALATLELLQEGNIIRRAREELAPRLQLRWAELADHPLVGETRGVGALAALELTADKNARDRSAARFDTKGKAGMLCRKFSLECGLVMRSVGDIMVVAPPLILELRDVDELTARARKALDRTAEALGI